MTLYCTSAKSRLMDYADYSGRRRRCYQPALVMYNIQNLNFCFFLYNFCNSFPILLRNWIHACILYSVVISTMTLNNYLLNAFIDIVDIYLRDLISLSSCRGNIVLACAIASWQLLAQIWYMCITMMNTRCVRILDTCCKF